MNEKLPKNHRVYDSESLYSFRIPKFRAWCFVKKDWHDNHAVAALIYANQIYDAPNFSPITQFAGLVDKNGIDIFEGDIVTFKRSVGNFTGKYMKTTHRVFFSDEVFAFVMKYRGGYIKLRKHWGYEYEIIGNIYQNIDLLNQD